MFVEHKEAVEITEQPAKVLKLSEAIREGHKHIREKASVFLHKDCGCALGAAAYALGMRAEGERGLDGDSCKEFLQARIPGWNHFELSLLSGRHAGGASRLDIAAELEAQGL